MRREPYFDGRAFDARDEAFDADLRTLCAPKAFDVPRLAARLVFAAALIAGLATIAAEKAASLRASPSPAGSRGAAAMVRPVKPAGTAVPLLAMDAADPAARADPPRWNPATGLREDGLSQGRFDAIEAPFLRVTVTETARDQTGSEPPASLFVTLARRAAETQRLSVARTGVRGALDTKFGRFETVDATLSGEGERRCTGFASLGSETVRIDGWLCGVLGTAPEPQAVVCALDRLRLAGAAAPKTEIAFGEAELRRTPGCGAGSEAAGPDREAGATGSISGPGGGRKGTAGERAPSRPRKNVAEPRRNA